MKRRDPARSGRLFDDPARTRRGYGRTRRAAARTVAAWRDTGKLEAADDLAKQLLYESTALLDETLADPDDSHYVRAMVLGKVTDVVRYVEARVAPGDAGGPSLADLLAGVHDDADTGPPD